MSAIINAQLKLTFRNKNRMFVYFLHLDVWFTRDPLELCLEKRWRATVSPLLPFTSQTTHPLSPGREEALPLAGREKH